MASKRHYTDPYEYLRDDGEVNPVITILDALKQKEQDKTQLQETAQEANLEVENATLPADKTIESQEKEYETLIKDLLSRSNSDNEHTRETARNELKEYLSGWGLKYVNNIKYYPLSREEKHIIRMDYYGTIDEPVKIPGRSKSTSAYLAFINSPYKEKIDNPQYDLDSSPAWNKFRQFPRFRKIEKQMLEQLKAEKVPPHLIPQMNAYDYADILYRAFKDTADEYGKVRIFNGARRSFVKDFIRNNEPQFRQYLKRIRVDDRYTEALIEMMQKKGITTDIDVFDKQKAILLLEKYKEDKLLPPEEEINEKISSKQLEFIKYRGDYGKIAILDEEGKALSGPTFTVHHKIAVKDGGEATYLADVNHFENLCLMVNEPYHHLMHSLDKTEISNFRESYKARIYMQNPHIIFWGGISQDYQIHYDYSQDERSLRLMENNYKWIAEHLSNIKPLPDIDTEKQNGVIYNNKQSRKQKKQQQKQQEQQNTEKKTKKRIPNKKKKTEEATIIQDISQESLPQRQKADNRKARIFKEMKQAYIQKRQEKYQINPKNNPRKVAKIQELIAALYQAKKREEEAKTNKDKLPAVIYKDFLESLNR